MRGRDIFYIGKPILVGASWMLRLIPARVSMLLLVVLRHFPTRIGCGIRYVLLKRLARACGDNVAVFEGVYLYHVNQIEIGDHVSIHPMCYIDGRGGVCIGSNTSIAHNTTIITFEHIFSQSENYTRDQICGAAVNIGQNVLIGCGVRILAGVTIGDNVIVGAGAVVTKNILANSLAIGVPARMVKQL